MVTEHICEVCKEKFLTSLPIQLYCGGFCRRKAARNRAKDKKDAK